MSPRQRRQHMTFRLPEATLERLDSRAHQVRESRTGLAERYLEEGLRMDEHAGIGFVDGPAGRRAVVVGTGLDVWEVVETVRHADGSIVDAAAYLEVEPALVRVATRYYASFPAEVDAILSRQAEVAEREEATAARERATFG